MQEGATAPARAPFAIFADDVTRAGSGCYSDEVRASEASRLRALAGAAELDPAGVDACLTAIEADPCSMVWRLDDGCEGAIVGLVELGQPCLDDLACADGSSCSGAVPGACGTCVSDVGEGEDCTAAGCAPGLGCVPEGRPNQPATSACRRRPAEGEGCSSTCALGLYCGSDTASDPPTCRRPEVLARGATCAPSLHYAMPCEPGTVCGVGGVCAPPPSEGEPCQIDVNGYDLCADGLACDPIGEVCMRYVALGGACSGASTCGLSARCVGGVCLARGLEGDACDGGEASCWGASGLECVEGTCVVASCPSLP